MSNTEAKLKQLKVAELRDILQRASVAVPTKATKADLITKILTTPSAVDIFNNNKQSSTTGGAPSDKPSAALPLDNDLLLPPEQFDWESPTVVTAPVSSKVHAPVKTATATATATAPSEKSVATTKPPASTTTATTTTPQSSKIPAANDELEKRKKRAERFGVPLVESKQKLTPATQNVSRTPADEVGKLQARAARFGVPVTNSSQKRGRSPAPVDKEEEERRRKRAEKFGVTSTKT